MAAVAAAPGVDITTPHQQRQYALRMSSHGITPQDIADVLQLPAAATVVDWIEADKRQAREAVQT